MSEVRYRARLIAPVLALAMVLISLISAAGYADTTARVAAKPNVATFTAHPTRLSSRGGTVTLWLRVLHGHSCVLSASPHVSRLPRRVRCGARRARINVSLPANHNGTPHKYTLTVRAHGKGTTTKRVTITVGGAVLGDVVQVGTGLEFSCALLTTGRVDCWGSNEEGSLGDGVVGGSSSVPVQVHGLAAVKQIATGEAETCAVLDDGHVECWGFMPGQGQSGHGPLVLEDVATPKEVPDVSDAIEVSAGTNADCALLATHHIVCWGLDGDGILGDGEPLAESAIPVEVKGVSNASSVAVADDHVCAVLATGAVDCWGANSSGQLGDETHPTDAAEPAEIPSFGNVAQVTNAQSHSCAVLGSGRVDCWGYNAYGFLGRPFVAEKDSATPLEVNVPSATSVSAGGDTACAILTTHRAYCWGGNFAGQTGDGTAAEAQPTPSAVVGLSSAKQVSSGGRHTCAVSTQGQVFCWGLNQGGDLGQNTHLAQSATPLAVGL